MTTATDTKVETAAAAGAATVASASEFDKLVGEITDVAKAFGEKDKKKKEKSGDKKIEGAAEGDEVAGEEDIDDGEFGKSFEIKLEDGSVVKAFDGAPMFKALTERAEKAEAALAKVWDVVKALREEVETIGKQGRGRKTVVSVTEKQVSASTDVTKSAGAGESMTAEAFMAKAAIAATAGKISGFELTKLENYIGKGLTPPADLVAKALS